MIPVIGESFALQGNKLDRRLWNVAEEISRTFWQPLRSLAFKSPGTILASVQSA